MITRKIEDTLSNRKFAADEISMDFQNASLVSDLGRPTDKKVTVSRTEAASPDCLLNLTSPPVSHSIDINKTLAAQSILKQKPFIANF